MMNTKSIDRDLEIAYEQASINSKEIKELFTIRKSLKLLHNLQILCEQLEDDKIMQHLHKVETLLEKKLG